MNYRFIFLWREFLLNKNSILYLISEQHSVAIKPKKLRNWYSENVIKSMKTSRANKSPNQNGRWVNENKWKTLWRCRSEWYMLANEADIMKWATQACISKRYFLKVKFAAFMAVSFFQLLRRGEDAYVRLPPVIHETNFWGTSQFACRRN